MGYLWWWGRSAPGGSQTTRSGPCCPLTRARGTASGKNLAWRQSKVLLMSSAPILRSHLLLMSSVVCVYLCIFVYICVFVLLLCLLVHICVYLCVYYVITCNSMCISCLYVCILLCP